MKQPGKKSDTTSVKKKENEICQYPKDLNPFANSNGTTDNDCAPSRTAGRPPVLVAKGIKEDGRTLKVENTRWKIIHLMILMR